MRASLLRVDLGHRVEAVFTRRDDGGSVGPWRGLNLALHVGDDPAAVATNRRVVHDVFDVPVVFGRQVHGVGVELVRPGALAEQGFDPLTHDLQEGPGVDALVTTGDDVALGVLVADCVPVLLVDPTARVAGTAHAGRGGLLAGVLQAALAAMVDQGARPGRIRAALGPAAGGCCYEVPQAMQDAACALLPRARATTTWGTPSLDLRAGCVAVLEESGVTSVTVVGGCTIEDDDSFSYRRAQQSGGSATGRFAGVLRLLP